MARYVYLRALAFSQLAFGLGALSSSSPAIQWVNCSEHIPLPLQGTTLPSPLPIALHCGLLAVPMDYSKPISSQNNITLGFAMHRPNNSQGLLNFNPGGPDAEVASFAWDISLNVSNADWFTGLANFDFLAVDVRGTYQSNPLNCTIGNLTLPSSLPSTAAELKSYQNMAATFANSCNALSTPAGILAHVGTADVVKDWDSLRAALGYKTVNYLGYSYGTFAGALYASEYPERMGRFILDAILPHGLGNQAVATYQVAAANRLLLRSDAWCQNDTTCPFHAQGKGSIPKAFATVLAQAAAGNTSNLTVTPSDVGATASIAYLNGFPKFPALNSALAAALGGDWSGFDWTAFEPELAPGIYPLLATACLDRHIDFDSWASFEKIKEAVFSADTAHIGYVFDLQITVRDWPDFILSHYVDSQNLWQTLCSGWPYHGNSSTPIPLKTPVLLVTSDFDYNCPSEMSTYESGQAAGSTLIVRHGDDHGTLVVPGPARSAEFAYLNTGVFPKATNQTFVTVYPSGSKRTVIPSPYAVPVGPEAGDIY
ncbi:alpha/beta-hydrolase [Athelia psychrophila]|uniref:Alpha/beta-hydrolase n=1 Tax=Athelia psychrophila TaxID=1759441 RepID=A0A166GE54_9AGAM|nr:alpha/beta-hydrolase [Fibularhizoctonia sp. CBS 109695]